MAAENLIGRIDVIFKERWSLAFRRSEENDSPFHGLSICIPQLSVAITASGGLGERIEAGERPIYDGEIYIHPSFNYRRCDEATGLAVLLAPLDLMQDRLAMRQEKNAMPCLSEGDRASNSGWGTVVDATVVSDHVFGDRRLLFGKYRTRGRSSTVGPHAGSVSYFAQLCPGLLGWAFGT